MIYIRLCVLRIKHYGKEKNGLFTIRGYFKQGNAFPNLINCTRFWSVNPTEGKLSGNLKRKALAAIIWDPYMFSVTLKKCFINDWTNLNSWWSRFIYSFKSFRPGERREDGTVLNQILYFLQQFQGSCKPSGKQEQYNNKKIAMCTQKEDRLTPR